MFLQLHSVVLFVCVLQSLSLSPQYHPDPGGHHHSQGSESQQLPGGDDGSENVSQRQEGNKKRTFACSLNFDTSSKDTADDVFACLLTGTSLCLLVSLQVH